MIYKVADGHNVALGSLVTIDPQPASPGIQPTRRINAASGDVYDDAEYVIFVFSALQDEAQVLSVLTQFGLHNAEENDVTIYCRDKRFQSVRMNGTAILPENGRDLRWTNYFPRDMEILVRDLETPS